MIYTNSTAMLDGYMDRLKDKMEVSGYIPRAALMKILKTMDFLVNFDNNTLLNSPSKLIDYAIVNKPVLNIGRDFDAQKVHRFLMGDYTDSMALPNPEQYHISNVSKQFLDLI
ncbi:hypothetical protein [Saccharicrinis fermentans]|uniref:hypothetical protein n=1 Tax=Saccharicrinis fermentans TaxID=982 RepID=UPI001267A1CB|nr:hypothetical protein [Saccharicrinis fermentans]